MEPRLLWGLRGLAGKSQTEVRSCSSPVRVSLVTHTSPMGHETQRRDGMGYFGAEFQERHFLYPHPAPILSSCHPAAGSGQLGPPTFCKHPSVGNTRNSGDDRSKGLSLSKKTSQALGQPLCSHSLAEPLPGRTAWVCNPVSPMQWDQANRAFPNP